jgi:hypothetical protein
MKIIQSIVLCFTIINCSFSQGQQEMYNVINDYLSYKTIPGLKTFLYFKAGESDIFDSKDSLLINKIELKSKFKFLDVAEYRVKLIDSLFGQFDIDYMRLQNKYFVDYNWKRDFINSNINLFKNEKELKGGFKEIGLSVPIFINKKNNWALLHDLRVSLTWIVLLKKENNKWIIVEEYIYNDLN